MRYRFLPFPLFQTRPKRNGVKTGHASCPPEILRRTFESVERLISSPERNHLATD